MITSDVPPVVSDGSTNNNDTIPTTNIISNNSTNMIPAPIMNRHFLTAAQIPCCLCGTMIYPNGANQCSVCLAQNFNLQERIQRGNHHGHEIILYQCRECRRFQRTEKHFERYELESSELLALCLKQIPALQNSNHSAAKSSRRHNNDTSTNSASDKIEINTAPIKVMDAKWVWTEPHCMRLKIHLTVRTELCNVPVQQRCLVELHVLWKQCYDCAKEYKSRTWHVIVQLRQKQSYKHGTAGGAQQYDTNQTKQGLTMIENAMGQAKSQIRKDVLKMDHVKYGFDFYFMKLSQAQSFVSFLQTVVPMRLKTSSKLVSTDSKSNTAHMKHTITCDIVPILKHDLLLIHKSTPKNSLSGKLAIVISVTNSLLQLQDASPPRRSTSTTGSTASDRFDLSIENYYKHEKYYTVLQSSNRLTRFIVVNVELCDNDNTANDRKYSNDDTATSVGTSSNHLGSQNNNNRNYYKSRYALADVAIVRESDAAVALSPTTAKFHVVTHLGHLLHPGDIVLGYDLVASTKVMSYLSNDHLDVQYSQSLVRHNFICPDVVLVKKVSSSHRKANNHHHDDDDDDDENGGTIQPENVAVNHTITDDDNNNVSKCNHDDNNDSSNKQDDDDDDNHTKISSQNDTRSRVTSGKSNHKNNNEYNDDEYDTGKPKLSKKKKRRRIRQEGKRKKQLEESAKRMGLIPSDDTENKKKSYNSMSDDDDDDDRSYENNNIMDMDASDDNDNNNSIGIANSSSINDSNNSTKKSKKKKNLIVKGNAMDGSVKKSASGKNIVGKRQQQQLIEDEANNDSIRNANDAFDAELQNDPILAEQLSELLIRSTNDEEKT